MVDKINKLIDLSDSDPTIGYEIVKYILNNDEMIDSFLNKHGLSNLFFFPIGSVFYLVNLPDDVRKALAQLKDDKFKIEYLKRLTVLMELKRDNSLQEALGVDEDKIEYLLSVYNQILDIPKPIRYNDKNILKEKLRTIFVMFIESGLGQKEQINIIIDLFEQENFEDYKNGWSENRFDRVRKSYYEPALKLFNSVYGK